MICSNQGNIKRESRRKKGLPCLKPKRAVVGVRVRNQSQLARTPSTTASASGSRSFPDFPPLFPDVHSFFSDSCGSLHAVAVPDDIGHGEGEDAGAGGREGGVSVERVGRECERRINGNSLNNYDVPSPIMATSRRV